MLLEENSLLQRLYSYSELVYWKLQRLFAHALGGARLQLSPIQTFPLKLNIY